MADQTEAGSRSPGPRPDGAGGPGGARALLLLALLGGAAVAAVSLHAGGGDLGGAVGPLHGEWLLVLLVLAVGGWFLAAKYRARQDERPLGTAREGRLITLTFTALVLTILGTAVAVAVLGMHTHTSPPPPAPPPPPPPAPTGPPNPPQPVSTGPIRNPHPPFVFSIQDALLVLFWAAVALLLVLGVIAARRYLRGRSAPVAVLRGTLQLPAEEEALSAAVSAGRLALAGEDVRAAVIACYAAMEQSLAESGLGRRASDSPADLLERATAAGLLVGPAAQRLAELFREARYSSHPMTQDQLNRARTALDDIGHLLAEHRAEAERAAAAAAATEAPAGASADPAAQAAAGLNGASAGRGGVRGASAERGTAPDASALDAARQAADGRPDPAKGAQAR
ncbi:DUF4129 domain-containing protein [Streptacidiphilus cavernicola]|uniref:DUF4129 domain-containing protein n=1 Tax=Streptacidiphilus cavernicola TaxID=3342716 RepID=A0ABV6VSW0_9ACTN